MLNPCVFVVNIVIDESEKQTADVSWWPKAVTWENGTFDLGYWTPFAEVWFRTRLDRIRSHEARPKTGTAWKNDLKGAHGAKNLKLAVHAASRKFLERHRDRMFQRALNGNQA